MRKPIELLYAITHGAMGALNLLGLTYNLMRVKQGSKDNMKDVLIHAFGLCYHIMSVYMHAIDAKGRKPRRKTLRRRIS